MARLSAHGEAWAGLSQAEVELRSYVSGRDGKAQEGALLTGECNPSIVYSLIPC